MLDDTPRTTYDIAKAIGIRAAQAGNTLRILCLKGDVTETMTEGAQVDRLISAWKVSKPREAKEIRERGEYKGEPLPFRYRQRENSCITLGTIETD
jgi:hypothetical protein